MSETPAKKRGAKKLAELSPLWKDESSFANDISAIVHKSVDLGQALDSEREYLIKRAPNAIEWITKPEYLNQPSIYNYYGAYSLVKEFFELRCPVCNVGPNAVPRIPWTEGQASSGLSRETLEAEVLLVWTPKYDDDSCPKCGTTRAEFVEDGLFNNHRVLHAIVGQRSGKSTVLAQLGTYIEHVVYTIAHGFEGGLHKYLGMPKGDTLDISYVASTDTQAKLTIWAKYRGFREQAPWFKRYVPWLKTQEGLQDTPDGMQRWTYQESDKIIKNGLVRLNIDSLNSNSNGLAGRTRILAAIDEICRMEMTEGPRSGVEVYRSMIASCQTVQTRVEQYGLVPWLGMIASISSPISEGDYGMQLLQQAKEDPRMFTIHKAVWDFNPAEPYSAYHDMLRKDRIGTMRNFGARPPAAASPLIERVEDFRSAAIGYDLEPTALFSPYKFTDSTGVSMLGVQLDHADLIINGPQRFIAVDAGKNFDAFSVACAHGENDEDGNMITVYDWLIRLVTESSAQEVYFESVYGLLAELTQYMTIKTVEFDHWQSTMIVQRIRNDLAVWAEEQETKPEHFIKFMRDAYGGYIKMLPELEDDKRLDPPYKSAQGAALYELLHLERDPKNDKVFNARKGKLRGWDSDDAARVCVHVHRLVQDQGYTERQDDTSRRARRKRSEVAMADWTAGSRGHVFDPKNGGAVPASAGPLSSGRWNGGGQRN